MTRTRFVLGACLLLLTGCTHLSSKQAFPKHYALTGTVAPVQRDRSASQQNATLEVARISVPTWLQGTELIYRLDYLHDDRIATYGGSDWVAPPARLLERMILNSITADGPWRAVIGPADPARADFTLHIRLDDFSQAFTSRQRSHGALDATATLIANRDGNVIAQKHFHIETAAPSADAAGGVKALNRAALQFTQSLQQWLRQAMR